MNSTPSSNKTPASGVRRLGAPFLVVCGILLAGAIGLNATVQAMKVHFQKLPVPIEQYGKKLTELPTRFGPYEMVSKDVRINEEVEYVLGTTEYVFRDYVDTRKLSADQVNRLKEMSEMDRRMELAKIQQTQPNAVLNLAVTYYTGMVDTVAHIPDRCYVADGYEPKEYRTMTWQTGNDPTSLRYINFEDQTGLQKVSRNVAYFFYANGEEKDDPLGVRLALQDLRQRYGYYAKVELMITQSDPDSSQATMTEFLGHAKPEIEACLPDWQRVIAEPVASAEQ